LEWAQDVLENPIPRGAIKPTTPVDRSPRLRIANLGLPALYALRFIRPIPKGLRFVVYGYRLHRALRARRVPFDMQSAWVSPEYKQTPPAVCTRLNGENWLTEQVLHIRLIS